jgi:hypothetical protein
MSLMSRKTCKPLQRAGSETGSVGIFPGGSKNQLLN